MLPLPSPRIFRSRRAALWWSFWVIVAAVLFVPRDEPRARNEAAAVDVAGEPLNAADVEAIAAALTR